MVLLRPARLPHLVVIAVFIALLLAYLGASPASAATGSITGKVTKSGGKVVRNSVVDLYSVDSEGYWFVKSVRTRDDGTYRFGSLPRGQYVVGFGYESRTYAPEYWNNKQLIQNATPISVRTSRVSGINARLAVGGKVTGQVITDTDSPRAVADVEVAAYRYDGGEWTYGKSAVTRSDGTFTVSGLSSGSWTLEFNPPYEGPDADLALEYWEDSRTFDENETFPVALGTTVTGKEARLSRAGRISGRITGPDGEPVVDAYVFGYPGAKENIGNVAFTDANGEYVMKGLSAGDHRLEFVDSLEFDPFGDGPMYASEWWDDKGSFETADLITVSVHVTKAGKDAQLDGAMAPLASASDNTSRPVEGHRIAAR